MESGSVVVDVPFESSVFFVFLGGPKTDHVYEWVLISSGQMACVCFILESCAGMLGRLAG